MLRSHYREGPNVHLNTLEMKSKLLMSIDQSGQSELPASGQEEDGCNYPNISVNNLLGFFFLCLNGNHLFPCSLIHPLISFSRSPSEHGISSAFPWQPQLLGNTKLSNIHSRTLTDGTRGREREKGRCE